MGRERDTNHPAVIKFWGRCLVGLADDLGDGEALVLRQRPDALQAHIVADLRVGVGLVLLMRLTVFPAAARLRERPPGLIPTDALLIPTDVAGGYAVLGQQPNAAHSSLYRLKRHLHGRALIVHAQLMQMQVTFR